MENIYLTVLDKFQVHGETRDDAMKRAARNPAVFRNFGIQWLREHAPTTVTDYPTIFNIHTENYIKHLTHTLTKLGADWYVGDNIDEYTKVSERIEKLKHRLLEFWIFE